MEHYFNHVIHGIFTMSYMTQYSYTNRTSRKDGKSGVACPMCGKSVVTFHQLPNGNIEYKHKERVSSTMIRSVYCIKEKKR